MGELTYLLESGSDRAGALDFQTSASKYVCREEWTRPLWTTCCAQRSR
jgi:serine/threonine-protein kinase HipA